MPDVLLIVLYAVLGFQILVGVFAVLFFSHAKIYIFYVFYLCFLVLTFVYFDLANNHPEIISKNQFLWEFLDGVVILLCIVFYVFFWVNILPYKKFAYKIYKLLTKYFIIIIIILGLYSMVFLNLNKKFQEFYIGLVIVVLYVICFAGLIKMLKVVSFEYLLYLIGSTLLVLSAFVALYFGFVLETLEHSHNELKFLGFGSILDTFFLSCGLVFNAYENGKKKIMLEYQVMDLKKQDLANKNLILENEFALMHARITPHFLQNTFDMVGNKINIGDAEASLVIIKTVSAYLRQIFNNVGKSVITLEDELSFTESYLKMQQIVHKNLFSYKIELDDNVDTYNIVVPTMILQPIVENCIKHGFKNWKSNRVISLFIREENNYCTILVQDNGNGLKENIKINNTRASGTQLTKDRLIRMFENGSPQNIVVDMQNRRDGVSGTEFKIKFLIQ